MIRRQAVGIYFLTLAIGGTAVVASAEEQRSAPEAQAPPASTVSAPASLSAAFQGAAASAATSEHIFGVGVRLGGYSFGAGGTVRFFLMGPWGVQAEVSRFGVGVAGFNYDYSSTMFDAEVLYRLNEIKVDAPLKLQPYAGGGVAIIRTSFYIPAVTIGGTVVPGSSGSNNSTAGVITGGVEVFF